MLDVSNKTWEDIFKEIVLTHGQKGIIVLVAIVSALLGGFLVWFYLTKFKYVLLETEKAKLEQTKETLTEKLENSNNKISELKTEISELKTEINKVKEETEDIQDYRFARQAKKSDTPDEALTLFVGKEDNT